MLWRHSQEFLHTTDGCDRLTAGSLTWSTSEKSIRFRIESIQPQCRRRKDSRRHLGEVPSPFVHTPGSRALHSRPSTSLAPGLPEMGRLRAEVLRAQLRLALRRGAVRRAAPQAGPAQLSRLRVRDLGHQGVQKRHGAHQEISMKKKVYLWVTVPCVNDFGSCDYDDICNVQDCPLFYDFLGLPCGCPIKEGDYSVRNKEFEVPALLLPDWITSGDYQVTVRARSRGEALFCVHFTLSLK
nr:uncharacterized protein LOC126537047 isoform X3 [Dermacentor andersoni]